MPRRDLTSTAKLVYMRLDEYQGDNGDAFPHLRTLAADVGKGVYSVQRAVDELIRAGLIVRESGANRGRRVGNRYHVVRTTDGAHKARCAQQGNGQAHNGRVSKRTTGAQQKGIPNEHTQGTNPRRCGRRAVPKLAERVIPRAYPV